MRQFRRPSAFMGFESPQEPTSRGAPYLWQLVCSLTQTLPFKGTLSGRSEGDPNFLRVFSHCCAVKGPKHQRPQILHGTVALELNFILKVIDACTYRYTRDRAGATADGKQREKASADSPPVRPRRECISEAHVDHHVQHAFSTKRRCRQGI